jgi:hypothetical protein
MRFEEFAATRLPAVLRFAGVLTADRAAPAAAQELPGLDGSRLRRRMRSPKATGRLAGIATAAALAGAVTAVTVTGCTSGTIPNDGVPSSLGATNVITLRAKLLAALSNTTDIVYVGWTSSTVGAPTLWSESWSYPWQPAAGQQVRIRTLQSGTDGKIEADIGETYLMPAPSSKSGGMLFTKGENITVEYVTKTWMDQKHETLSVETPQSPAELIKDTPTQRWTVRHTTLNGRAALELTTKDAVEDNSVGDDSGDTNLWFDASTYLPLREVNIFGTKNILGSATYEYQYLSATPANLAKLKPPIPAGFKQVAEFNQLFGEQFAASGPCIGSKASGCSSATVTPSLTVLR